MKRPAIILLVAAALFPLAVSAQGISQLQQFTATTSPAAAITQTVFGKAFRLTGQGSGCAQFSANGTLTSTGVACGSGSGGSSFAYPFPSNATSTSIAFNGGLTGTLTGALAGNASTATALQTGRTINGVTFDGTANITVTAASSTLLANNNTFSGSNTFSSTITGSVTGNAGTVTNGVYTTTFNGLFDPRFITDLAATTSVSSITTLPNLSLPYSQLTGTPSPFSYPFPSNATTTVLTLSNGASIAKLTNLTGNGFVKTSGGDGTLSIDTATYLIANQTITLSGVITGSGSTAITTAFGSQSAGVLGNPATGNTAVQATSTLYGAVQNGKVLAGSGGSLVYVATSTDSCSSGITCSYSGGTNSFSIGNNAITNAMLANSTISGVALGSNLNSFSVGSDFTGTGYNGSAAISDWALKMSQPHSWTGLQSFANASSSLFSVTSKAYFGGTATSTFDSAGVLTLAGITGSTQCLHVNSSGTVSGTGSDCGSGGSVTGTTGQVAYLSGTNTAVGTSSLFISTTGNVGVGTTTPWGRLSVANTSPDYIAPIFTVATSTDLAGQLVSVFATSSVSNLIGITSALVESGVRAVIGGIGTLFATTGALDQLYVNGRVYPDWGQAICDNISVPTVITAASQFCGSFSTVTVTASGSTLQPSAASTDITAQFAQIRYSSATAGAGGAGVFTGNNNWIVFASSTPVLEATARINSLGLSNAVYHVGFSSQSKSTASLGIEPTSGCYFVASSTQANWKAVCHTTTVGSAMTIVDTGIASTSNVTALGAAYVFRLQVDNDSAEFFIKNTLGGGFTKVARITTNIPTTAAMGGGVWVSITDATSATANFDLFGIRFWWQRVTAQR